MQQRHQLRHDGRHCCSQFHECDPHGTRQGIEQAVRLGVKREEMFITIKFGFAGPMDVPGVLPAGPPPPPLHNRSAGVGVGSPPDDKQGTNMYSWIGLV